MGGGASSLSRVRKALIIRAHNLRGPDQTLDDQFRRFATRDSDGTLCLSITNIKGCLMMESKEYDWVNGFFQHSFGTEGATIPFSDFIKFLETGKPPTFTGATTATEKEKPVYLTSVDDPKRSATPPLPPLRSSGASPERPPTLSSSGSYRSIADASSIKIEHVAKLGSRKGVANVDDPHGGEGGGADSDELEDSVLHINLSSVIANPHTLPSSVKLHAGDRPVLSRSASGTVEGASEDAGDREEGEEFTVIVHPSRSSQQLHPSSLPLWRKVETVRQERTVHYTTIDINGEQQELVEKETTQSEVLHMECKETGEFAHRETTKFEQLETFNAEVVHEVKGAEEYVHLKSKEDEYHHMESTMPNKEGGAERGDQPQSDRPSAEDAEAPSPSGREPDARYRGAGGGRAEGEEGGEEQDQAALEAEYADAYHLYMQKQEQEDRERRAEGVAADWADHHFSAPSPRPPPFSDDSSEGVARGFRASGAGRDEQGRAAEAFAFAEGMEHFPDSPEQPRRQRHFQQQESPEALFGERVQLQEDDGPLRMETTAAAGSEVDSGDIHGGHGARRASRDHLFEPMEPLTRTSSYESLHEID